MMLDLLVIGAGPAGVAAACEASRLGACCAIVDEQGEAGGMIRFAHEARNVPFLDDRSPGEHVAAHLRRMATSAGGVSRARIVSVASRPDSVIARSQDSRVFEARRVVVATGTLPLVPSIPGLPGGLERPWIGAGQGFDGAAGTRAAVIGGSDVAFDHARALRSRGIGVVIVCRGAAPRAPGWLQDAAAREGVALLCETQVESAARSGGRLKLVLRARGREQGLEVDFVVPAAGRVPCVPEGAGSLPRHLGRVVGDAVGRRARHVSIAMGDGCLAAFELLQGEVES